MNALEGDEVHRPALLLQHVHRNVVTYVMMFVYRGDEFEPCETEHLPIPITTYNPLNK